MARTVARTNKTGLTLGAWLERAGDLDLSLVDEGQQRAAWRKGEDPVAWVYKQQFAHVFGEEGFDTLWRSYGSLVDTSDRQLRQLVVGYLKATAALARYVGAGRELRNVFGALNAWNKRKS